MPVVRHVRRTLFYSCALPCSFLHWEGWALSAPHPFLVSLHDGEAAAGGLLAELCVQITVNLLKCGGIEPGAVDGGIPDLEHVNRHFADVPGGHLGLDLIFDGGGFGAQFVDHGLQFLQFSYLCGHFVCAHCFYPFQFLVGCGIITMQPLCCASLFVLPTAAGALFCLVGNLREDQECWYAFMLQAPSHLATSPGSINCDVLDWFPYLVITLYSKCLTLSSIKLIIS